MVDLATLTGAIIIALGNDYAGCYANDEELGANLMAPPPKEGEPLWRMPLPAQYDKNIDSMIADVKNTGGRPAARSPRRCSSSASPTACPGPTSTSRPPPGRSRPPSDHSRGATGFGVRLLNSMVQEKYEG
jgi:leucyl aminopeptidase